MQSLCHDKTTVKFSRLGPIGGWGGGGEELGESARFPENFRSMSVSVRCRMYFKHVHMIDAPSNRDSRTIYTYKRVVCVCWFVCLSSFYRPHDICPLCGAASECPRAAKPSRAAPRERASACTARARARMPYNFSTKKSLR